MRSEPFERPVCIGVDHQESVEKHQIGHDVVNQTVGARASRRIRMIDQLMQWPVGEHFASTVWLALECLDVDAGYVRATNSTTLRTLGCVE